MFIDSVGPHRVREFEDLCDDDLIFMDEICRPAQ